MFQPSLEGHVFHVSIVQGSGKAWFQDAYTPIAPKPVRQSGSSAASHPSRQRSRALARSTAAATTGRGGLEPNTKCGTQILGLPVPKRDPDGLIIQVPKSPSMWILIPPYLGT